MAKRKVFDLVLLLQVSLGVFFLVSGVLGLLDYNSTVDAIKTTFGNNEIYSLVAGVLMILSGISIIASLFLSIKSRTVHLALWIVLLLWTATIILQDIINVNYDAMNLFKTSTEVALKNAFLSIFKWLRVLAVDLVILSGICIVKKRGSL